MLPDKRLSHRHKLDRDVRVLIIGIVPASLLLEKIIPSIYCRVEIVGMVPER